MPCVWRILIVVGDPDYSKQIIESLRVRTVLRVIRFGFSCLFPSVVLSGDSSPFLPTMPASKVELEGHGYFRNRSQSHAWASCYDEWKVGGGEFAGIDLIP